MEQPEGSDGVTRRDFVNGGLVAIGALANGCSDDSAASQAAKAWDGFGGVGDYARSHGNGYAMVTAGHRMRDGDYDRPRPALDSGEMVDLLIVGGGISGLSAAFEFQGARKGGSCLILDNHEVFGGEAKRNEFRVGGHLLTGPQGANSFPIPQPGDKIYDLYTALGLPRSVAYVKPTGAARDLQFSSDNFLYQYWKDRSPNIGWYFSGPNAAQGWVRDIWRDDLSRAPYSNAIKADFMKWRSLVVPNGGAVQTEDGFHRWLDTMTLKDFIEKVMGLGPEVTRYVNPIVAAACSGMGCDVTSAFAGYKMGMPGFRDAKTLAELLAPEQYSFPGGNDILSRHFIKALIPSAIWGGRDLDSIMNQPVQFDALDDPGQPIRLRLGSTVVRVEHEGPVDHAQAVNVTYSRRGELRRTRARAVVMAGGSWSTRRAVRDLPEAHRAAYQEFYRTPMLIANVAVTNWRFMANLRLTACRWFDGFGYSCSIRPTMAIGRDRPPIDPDQPAVITFYVPFFYPGTGTIHEQAARGRGELLATGYAEYERRIRDQMALLFTTGGFKQTDIAGIILNRWGHAYLCPQPGFFFGIDGKVPARDVIRTPHGQISFAHSELNGEQNWIVAALEGRRAALQGMAIL